MPLFGEKKMSKNPHLSPKKIVLLTLVVALTVLPLLSQVQPVQAASRWKLVNKEVEHLTTKRNERWKETYFFAYNIYK